MQQQQLLLQQHQLLIWTVLLPWLEEKKDVKEKFLP